MHLRRYPKTSTALLDGTQQHATDVAAEQHGWEQISSTVQHELIHAWQYHEFGDADHCTTFTRWTDALDTSQHFERFTTPKWWLICEDCGG